MIALNNKFLENIAFAFLFSMTLVINDFKAIFFLEFVKFCHDWFMGI